MAGCGSCLVGEGRESRRETEVQGEEKPSLAEESLYGNQEYSEIGYGLYNHTGLVRREVFQGEAIGEVR